jgi:murein DD-endopeptidase MepM/ murein hydrolase activator NlpD
MARKWVVRIIAILMALVMALSVLYVVVSSLQASAVSQSQIDALKKQQKDIEKKKQEIKSKINSLEYEQKSAIAKKEVLDDQIQLTQDDIANISDQIDEYTQLIEVKKGEVIQSQKNEDNQWAHYKENMRMMEENGTISYISVIFNADSFADLLARVDLVGSIMDHDEKLYEQLKAAKQATVDAKTSLETAKADQEADKADLISKQAELETQRTQADALVQKIDDNIDAAKDLYQQEVDAANSIQSDINKKMDELKKQKQQVVGTGNLIWPTPSCNIVTSPYGQRYHPIYHEFRMHNGIDIGAKYGASIVAADSGVVIISEYSSSYGNYIVISHGNNVTTLYAHMSSRIAKVGDKVKQGDVIGKVGSTGASTGPHVHFEVSVNGARVNPLNYFDSSSYVKQGW